MTKLERLSAFLSDYGTAYRVLHNLPANTTLSLPFLLNDGQTTIFVGTTEPTIQIGGLWWNEHLHKCVSVAPDTLGHFNTYELVVHYEDVFDTSLQFIGEHVPGITYSGGGDPTVPANVGSLLVGDGTQYVPFEIGDQGDALIVDTAATLGLTWLPVVTRSGTETLSNKTFSGVRIDGLIVGSAIWNGPDLLDDNATVPTQHAVKEYVDDEIYRIQQDMVFGPHTGCLAGSLAIWTDTSGRLLASGPVVSQSTLTFLSGTPAVQRTALGLGTCATRNVGTGINDVAAGIHAHTEYAPNSAAVESIAVLGTGPDKMLFTTAANEWAETTITASGRQLLQTAGVTGVGPAVQGESPTLVTPILGDATATSINGLALGPTMGSSLAIGAGKDVAIANSVRIQATDGAVIDFGTGGTLGTAAFTSAEAFQPRLTYVAEDQAARGQPHGLATLDVTGIVDSSQLPVFLGSSGVLPGTPGLVPGATVADQHKFLTGSGTWVSGVVGPPSTSDSNIVLWDGTDGTRIKAGPFISVAGRALISATDVVQQRQVLNLGNSATLNVGTTSNSVAAGNHSHPDSAGGPILAGLAGVAAAANKLPYLTGVASWELTDITPTGRAVLSAANAASVRESLELSAVATMIIGNAAGTVAAGNHTHLSYQPRDDSLTSLSGIGTRMGYFPFSVGFKTWAESRITPAGRLFLDQNEIQDQRRFMGLGDAATKNVGTGINDVAAGTHTHPGLDLSLTEGAIVYGGRSGAVQDAAFTWKDGHLGINTSAPTGALSVMATQATPYDGTIGLTSTNHADCTDAATGIIFNKRVFTGPFTDWNVVKLLKDQSVTTLSDAYDDTWYFDDGHLGWTFDSDRVFTKITFYQLDRPDYFDPSVGATVVCGRLLRFTVKALVGDTWTPTNITVVGGGGASRVSSTEVSSRDYGWHNIVIAPITARGIRIEAINHPVGVAVTITELRVFEQGASLGTAIEVTDRGDVGLGTVDPYARLDVRQHRDLTALNVFRNSKVGTETQAIALFRSNVYGPNTVTHEFNSDGTIFVPETGGYGQRSDARFKTNIRDATSKLEGLLQLQIRNFEGTSGTTGTGVIAQEIQKVFPELVREGDDGMLSVRTSDLLFYLIQGVQELHAIIKKTTPCQ